MNGYCSVLHRYNYDHESMYEYSEAIPMLELFVSVDGVDSPSENTERGYECLQLLLPLSSFANYYIKNSCFCHSHSYSESLPSILHSQVIIPLKNLLDRFPYDVRLPPLSSNNELQSLHLPSLVPQYPPNYSEEALQDWKTCVVVFVQRTLKSFRCSIDV